MKSPALLDKLPNYMMSVNRTKLFSVLSVEEHQKTSNVFGELQRASSGFEAVVILLPCSNRPAIQRCSFHPPVIMIGQ